MSIFMHILNFQKKLIKYRIKRAIRKPKVMKHEDWKLRRQQNEEDAYRHIELYDKQPSFEDNTKIAHSYSIGTLIIFLYMVDKYKHCFRNSPIKCLFVNNFYQH